MSVRNTKSDEKLNTKFIRNINRLFKHQHEKQNVLFINTFMNHMNKQ